MHGDMLILVFYYELITEDLLIVFCRSNELLYL